MFVTILRRVLVEETDLPFPESIAAAEIHKAGQGGAKGTGTSSPAWGSARPSRP